MNYDANTTAWSSIPNTDYQASLFTGMIRHAATGRLLPQRLGRSAVRYYCRVSFSGHTWLVHRLIMSAALGRELTRDEQVRHLDGNSLRNNITNLAVGTARSNSADRYLHGTAGRKLRCAHIHEIRALAAAGISVAELARRYEVTRSHVRAIVTRRRWSGLA